MPSHLIDGSVPSQAAVSKQSVCDNGWFSLSWQMSIRILKSLDKFELFLHLTLVCISKLSRFHLLQETSADSHRCTQIRNCNYPQQLCSQSSGHLSVSPLRGQLHKSKGCSGHPSRGPQLLWGGPPPGLWGTPPHEVPMAGAPWTLPGPSPCS